MGGLSFTKPRAWMTFGAVLLASVSLGVGLLAADGPMANLEAVYAAFTVNLTRFITWPAKALGPPGTPFLIGTFPFDPINVELDQAVRGEAVAGHPLATIRLNSPRDVTRCRVVFVSRGVADLAQVLAWTAGRPILAVSDAEGFLRAGGHVRFIAAPPHTRLEISAANLKGSGLQAQAQLLRLASPP